VVPQNRKTFVIPSEVEGCTKPGTVFDPSPLLRTGSAQTDGSLFTVSQMKQTSLPRGFNANKTGYMLSLRAILFTLLVPGSVVGLIPDALVHRWPIGYEPGLVRYIGLAFILVGLFFYTSSTVAFLTKGRGTPAIWFTKPIRFILGEEPRNLVVKSLYLVTRNPMYLGVTAIVFGEAIWSGKEILFPYAVLLWFFFHFIIILVEEPHLRRLYGTEYERYCRMVPRWIGFRKRSDENGHDT
jgi:protein-S-isoprenylcysteine O-methyltransferase Ste14